MMNLPVLSGMSSIFSLLLIIGISIIAVKKGVFKEEHGQFLSTVVINIAIPSLIFLNVIHRFTVDVLRKMSFSIVLLLLVIFCIYYLLYLLLGLFSVDQKYRAVLPAMFCTSNTIFIGYPVNQALFGEEAITYVLLYFLANTTIFWSVILYQIKKASSQEQDEKISFISKIFNPPLIGFLFGMIWVIFSLPLPGFLETTLTYLGNAATPLALFVIGINISFMTDIKLSFDWKILSVILAKFVVFPLIIFFIFSRMDLDPLAKNVFLVEASMPVMTQLAIATKKYQVLDAFASKVVFITTVLSIIVIPIYSILYV